MLQIIPTIGTILALAAFFFALYFKAVQKYSRIAIDSVKSVGQLPARSRLDATKILVNVFDLDVKNMTADQQFELAKRTFEKRATDSKRNFLLFLLAAFVFLTFAAVYALSQVNGGAMVKSALQVDRASAVEALREKGFYNRSDKSLVADLAKSVSLSKIDDPFERAAVLPKMVAKQPTVAELRSRAEKEVAPFEIAGDIVRVTVPARADQPERFKAYVKRSSPLAGAVVTISAKGRSQSLKLLARDGIDNASSADIQLNYEQFVEIFGTEPNQPREALVYKSSSDRTFDPTCPRYPGFSITACDLLPVQELRDIF